MRKLICLLLLALCSAPAIAVYTYTVSGKVTYGETGLPVSGAVVTLPIYWPQGTTYGSKISASDGSFSFTLTSDSWDFDGVSMSLKATTKICTGSTSWECENYSETKNVKVSCNMIINPNLSVVVMPAHFTSSGPQPPVTVVAFMDQSGAAPVQVQQFNVVLQYNPEELIFMNATPSPDSIFMITVLPQPGIGKVVVHGEAMVPVLVDEVPPAESFFDVFFEVPEGAGPVFTSLIISEESMLMNPTSPLPEQHPYPHVTEILIGEPEKCKPTFLIDDFEEWEEVLMGVRPGSNIRPATIARWEQYMEYWRDPSMEHEGEPYPETTFVPPCEVGEGLGGMLYVWPGDQGGISDPMDAGLVMAWQFDQQREGDYASAWEWDYGLDPDLSNCTIQVTVTPPIGVNINVVSFSIVDIANRMRTWWWAVPGVIPQGVPTTVKINTAIAGIGAAIPPASGYMSVPGFDITKSQFFTVDENFKYVFGQVPVPPPGQPQFVGAWNYWHNLIVTKNTQAYKSTWPKWTQGPYVLEDATGISNVPKIWGWDDVSVYYPPQWTIVADDWLCQDERPVTDIHWWGSFIGWRQPVLPPVVPKAFHLGIWTDVPISNPSDPLAFSHPGRMIWEHVCDNWVWNFAGYDADPRCDYDMICQKNEACFQFNQLLSQDDWFFQKPDPEGKGRVYWLSISAIYDPQDWAQIRYPWGWKTRPHFFNDDAVRIFMTPDGIWPPKLGSTFGQGEPIQLPPYPSPGGMSWDMAFELTTNVKPPCHTLEADINHDCIVNLLDLRIMAQQWLMTSP